MRRVVTIFVGFVHDLATGCWVATVAAVWFLERQQVGAEVAAVLTALQQRFFWAGVASMVLVLATGAGRTFTYVPDVYGAEAEARRRRMLVAKHVVLLGVFGGGTWWQYLMAFAG